VRSVSIIICVFDAGVQGRDALVVEGRVLGYVFFFFGFHSRSKVGSPDGGERILVLSR
jgi:hypothetical protein